MLIELYGKNFGCFRDEFRLSLLATDIDPDSSRGIVEVKVAGDDEPLRLLRCIAIYGPNASGKSTVLRAAGALNQLLGETLRLGSDSLLPAYEPFALGPGANEPTTLGAKFVADERILRYEVSYTQAAVSSERLRQLNVDGSEVSLIERDLQQVSGSWTNDPRFALLQSDFRKNALLLSLADNFAPALAQGINVRLRALLYAHVDEPPMFESEIPRRVHEDAPYRNWLLEHLRSADIGVVAMDRRKVDMPWWLRNAGVDPHSETREELSLVHQAGHSHVALPYHRESLGTRRFVEWSSLFYDLLHANEPEAAFVDELDASMHPVLLASMIRQFNCAVPAARAQLVFTTHETSLLDAEAKDAVLRRDQVYLTEKGPDGAARLYSVADFRERNNLNMRRRYLQGRYGALPSVGDLAE